MESSLSAVTERLPEPNTRVSSPAPRRGRNHLLLLQACTLSSALLLFLCFFPVGWGWLTWVALVPMLVLVRSDLTARWVYSTAFMGGFAFFMLVLQWVPVADYRMYFAWVLTSIYCALYVTLAFGVVRVLDRHTALPLLFTFPAVWVTLEYVRSFFLSGFAWGFLGHTQHDALPLIQISDLGGVYLVSYLIAVVNVWVFEVLYQQGAVRAVFFPGQAGAPPHEERWSFPTRLVVQGTLVLLALAGTLWYGFWRLEQSHFTQGPRVALLQGNLDQRIRNDQGNDRLTMAGVVQHYQALCYAVSRQAQPPDLIIWPETSFPQEWLESSPNLPVERIPEAWRSYEASMRNLVATVVKLCRGYHLMGMNATVLDDQAKEQRFNSAVLVQPDGLAIGRYDKIHRLPFGEFVPFKDTLPFMKWLAPYDYDYSIRAGEHYTRLKLGDYRLGVLICYEDTDPVLARQYGKEDADGPPAHFLVNMSNDGWFDGSTQHVEHLAIARFRAIESRRAVVRAVNMGVSAVIDGNGRVLQPEAKKVALVILKDKAQTKVWGVDLEENEAEIKLIDHLGNRVRFPRLHVREHFLFWEWHLPPGPSTALPTSAWHTMKKVAGVYLATVPIDQRSSLYAQLGDWLPQGCALVIVGGLGWSWRRRTSLRRHEPAA